MVSFISSFEIISEVVPDPKLSSWMASFVAEATVINPKGTKVLVANGVSTFFINGKSAVIHSLRKLRNPPSRLLTFLAALVDKIPVL